MALKDRLSKMETQIKHDPQLGGVQWWGKLLADPKNNSDQIDAAYFLGLNELIPKPSPSMWKQVASRFETDSSTWPDFRLFATMAYWELVLENKEDSHSDGYFEEEEGKNALCWLAQLWWNLQKEAPTVQTEEGKKRGEWWDRGKAHARLRDEFVKPLYRTFFPEWEERYVDGVFNEWLECRDVVQPEAMLQSWRNHLAAFDATKEKARI